MRILLMIIVFLGFISNALASFESEYFQLLNQHRDSMGLNPLKHSFLIESVALKHSKVMASGPGRFGHDGWKQRCAIIRTKYKSYSCGEIVAKGQKTPAAVLKAWLNSPFHRDAIENSKYVRTGLGVIRGSDGKMYWTQLFIGE